MPRGTRLPDDARAALVADYRAGMTLNEIAAKYGVRDPGSALKKIGETRNRRPPMPPSHQLSAEQHAEIVNRYLAGETMMSLAVAFGIQYQSIRANLLRRSIPMREAGADRARLACNHGFFDELTPVSNYWAGFIMADGNVHQQNLSLCAAQPDADHIRQFVNDIGYEGTPRTRPNSPSPYSGAPTLPLTTITIYSPRMVEALAGFGIIPRKSLTAKVIDDRLLLSRDFWRGVVDGDGTLGWHPGTDRGYRYPCLQLCSGSITLLNQFRDFVRHHLPYCETHIHKSKTIWLYRLAGVPAVRIAGLLYENTPIALRRKAAVADTFPMFTARKFDIRFASREFVRDVLHDYYDSPLQWSEIATKYGISIATVSRIVNTYGHGVNRA